MKDFWKRVESLLTQDLNKAWLSKEINVPPSTFSNWITRDFDPKLSKAQAIADALGVSVEYLITGKHPFGMDTDEPMQPHKNQQDMPFYSVDLTYTNIKQIQDHLLKPTENLLNTPFSECDFCIRAVGNSMQPHIFHGDIVALQKLQSFRDVLWGELYVIITFEESKICTLKSLFQDPESPDTVILRSLNSSYPDDKVLQKHAIKDIYKVVGSMRLFG